MSDIKEEFNEFDNKDETPSSCTLFESTDSVFEDTCTVLEVYLSCVRGSTCTVLEETYSVL